MCCTIKYMNKDLAEFKGLAPYPARPLAYHHFAVMRDLAVGEMTRKEIAAKYGVSVSSLNAWITRHRKDIEEAKERLFDDISILPLANRKIRIAEYQDMYWEIRNLLDKRHSNPDRTTRIGDDKDSELYNQAKEMLKSIMIETGQQPPRQSAQSNAQVVNIVVGFDSDNEEAFMTGRSRVSVQQPQIIEGDVGEE